MRFSSDYADYCGFMPYISHGSGWMLKKTQMQILIHYSGEKKEKVKTIKNTQK